MRLWFWSILSLQNWHYSFLAMKTLYLFLHPSWGVKNSIFWSDNGIGQGGTICHSTGKLDNVMFSIPTASVVAKKSKVNLHESHFLGLHAKTGLRICRPENFKKEHRPGVMSISSCESGGEADVGNKAASHPSGVLDGGAWHTTRKAGRAAWSWNILYAVRPKRDAVQASSLQRSCSRLRLTWTWRVQEHRLPVQLLRGRDSHGSSWWCWQETC